MPERTLRRVLAEAGLAPVPPPAPPSPQSPRTDEPGGHARPGRRQPLPLRRRDDRPYAEKSLYFRLRRVASDGTFSIAGRFWPVVPAPPSLARLQPRRPPADHPAGDATFHSDHGVKVTDRLSGQGRWPPTPGEPCSVRGSAACCRPSTHPDQTAVACHLEGRFTADHRSPSAMRRGREERTAFPRSAE